MKRPGPRATRAELNDYIDHLIDHPMDAVIDALDNRTESSLMVALEMDELGLPVSASTVRTLRAGRHSGSLRVDVWGRLLRWAMTPAEVPVTPAD